MHSKRFYSLNNAGFRLFTCLFFSFIIFCGEIFQVFGKISQDQEKEKEKEEQEQEQEEKCMVKGPRIFIRDEKMASQNVENSCHKI